MKDFLLKLLVKYLLDYLSKENMEKVVEYLKAWGLPKLRKWKDELIAMLKAEAAKTGHKLDDAAVDALENLLEALLPDNAKHL